MCGIVGILGQLDAAPRILDALKRLDSYLNTAFSLGNSQTILILGRRNLEYTQQIKDQAAGYAPLPVVLSGSISHDDTEGLLNIAYQLYLHKALNLDVSDRNFQLVHVTKKNVVVACHF